VTTLGGFGGESFGDPFGGGGGLHVVRAIAVGGQVVRVVFNKAPRTKTPAANNDGLNGSNFAITVLTGQATTPLCVSALQVVQFPAFGLLTAGEVGVDVQTDRNLVIGLSYQVVVSPRIVAADGDSMGAPYLASFVGAARPTRTRRNSRSKADIIDLASGDAGLTVTNGDIGTVTGLDSTRIRCLRRTLTAKNSFAHLPGYGIGFQPKVPLSTARTGALKADLAQQIRSEPDVQNVTTNVTQDVRGFVQIVETIKTKVGTTLSLSVPRQ
jgi:hypothetical protein